MIFDIFLSICQNEVNGVIPSERHMFTNFFSQVKRADELGFDTAWIAETHLSCQVQKENPGVVIPHFQGEIGLNTDILQMAHLQNHSRHLYEGKIQLQSTRQGIVHFHYSLHLSLHLSRPRMIHL